MPRSNRPRPSTRAAMATLSRIKPNADYVRQEHDEQATLMSWISMAFPGVLAFAVPNAAKRSAFLAQRLKAEGLTPGIPDVYVEEARGGYFGLRIEMKRSDQARRLDRGLSGDQERIIPQLQRKGYKVVVCYSAQAAIDVLTHYMSLPPTVSVTFPTPVRANQA